MNLSILKHKHSLLLCCGFLSFTANVNAEAISIDNIACFEISCMSGRDAVSVLDAKPAASATAMSGTASTALPTAPKSSPTAGSKPAESTAPAPKPASNSDPASGNAAAPAPAVTASKSTALPIAANSAPASGNAAASAPAAPASNSAAGSRPTISTAAPNLAAKPLRRAMAESMKSAQEEENLRRAMAASMKSAQDDEDRRRSSASQANPIATTKPAAAQHQYQELEAQKQKEEQGKNFLKELNAAIRKFKSEAEVMEIIHAFIQNGGNVQDSFPIHGKEISPSHGDEVKSYTALSICFYYKPYPESIRLLIKNGVNKDEEVGDIGETMLHVAAKKGNFLLAEMLIEEGADINAQTGQLGRTPLDIAKECSMVSVIGLLEGKNAKSNN